ncbi:MAG: phosphoglycerate mutase family protein [Ilumatobacteraceae bacterium]
MTLYLVRHAKAGERRAWTGDDTERPLSSKGWKQASAVADRLGPLGVTDLVSSPFARCRQTLEPLATLLDLEVRTDRRLAEGTPFEETLALFDEVADGTALCSHGDVIPDAIQALVRRGLDLRSTPDWRKASVWAIERNSKGRYTRARAWPPPVL